MTQLLTLSRAAQLIGVSRHVLQRQIRAGELASQDGMIASDELLRRYPDLRLEDSGVLDPTTTLAGFTTAKCGRERILPTKEILSQRLFGQSNELADLRRHLARYHDLIESLQEEMAALAGDSAAIRDLQKSLEDGLAAVLGSQEPIDRVAVMDEVLRVVAAHVAVRPSGHEFFVEGSEPILEAALHAGLAPSYGCGNGNCGLCKARVIEGEVRQVRPFDYPLSAAERAQKYTLLCSHTAVSDLVIEMVEAATAADIPDQQIVARVKSVSPLDEHTYLLNLRSPRTNRLRYLAGQRVTLGVYSNRGDCRGEHAIASCPCDEHSLMFHISRAQADAGDAFAAALFAGAIHSGDSVSVWGPYGEFVLDQKSPRAIAFVCCDTGFAPVRGLIEHTLAVDTAPAVALFWAATRPGGQYQARQCRAWAESLDNFRYCAVDGADQTIAGHAAMERLQAETADPRDWDFYLAGGHAFVDTVRAGLLAVGVAAERIASDVS